ncbi:DegT/DnrJ/EryC1/StrS family aminotransferase [Sphingomonas mesophila]|uniref:DegT/DnrJ/EryC1/StrS family aminotransferase n=1 Tax=Sphingomonas mesophila TaxID=2303576 RepID=UPI000E57E3E8|nr:DegT/DnrJ/EryC1/StrS family aminotransferase [Sphingomonas mesophila]
MSEPVYVTRSSLPPLADVLPMLEQIWATRILSNRGPFHEELERAIEGDLGEGHVSLTTNGMLALEAALEAADLAGEVVTTPYSFVATSHAIRRANLTPVFADIRSTDCNIDPERVEAAITERTSAIVAVHCYGNPCDHERLADIAARRGLALIYDAAHAYGVTYRGRAVAAMGDFATLSFHATKAFNTFEGGAVISGTAAGKAAVDLWRNFGIASETEIPALGSNAKMSEFCAAIGLLQRARFPGDRAARAAVDRRYREALDGIAGLTPLPIPVETQPNHSYFPVMVAEPFPLDRDALYEALKGHGIFSRRYFYPLLSDLPTYREHESSGQNNLPVAAKVAREVLCLPIYPDLEEGEQQRVIDAIWALGKQA